MILFISRKELIKLIRTEVEKFFAELPDSSEHLESAIGFQYRPEENDPDEYFGKREEEKK